MNNKYPVNKTKSLLVAMSAAGVMFSSAALNAEENTRLMVNESEPRVQVDQPAADVSVNQQQPQVDVQTQDPEVSVSQPEAQIQIDQPQPEVSIEQSEPEVVVNEAEPQIEVDQEEPNISVHSAEPEVHIVDRDAMGNEKEPGQSGSPQSLMQAEIRQIKGATVENAQGEEIGDVDDVVVSRQGDEKGLVVSVGGFLGIGASEIFVPANEAEVQGDKIVWQTQESADRLKESSAYEEDRYEAVPDHVTSLSELESGSAAMAGAARE